MQPKSMLLMSMAFVVLGFVILIVGAIMLIASSKYPPGETAGPAILRISGRVACISGGLLIACTLCACLYTCVIGSSYSLQSVPPSNTTASQVKKAGQPGLKSCLKHPSIKGANYRWDADEKHVMSSALQNTLQHKKYMPGGDTTDKYVVNDSNEKPWKNTHNSVKLGRSTNQPARASDFPRLPDRRRRHSVDKANIPFSLVPHLPTAAQSVGFNESTSGRLWNPSVAGGMNFTGRSVDHLSSKLLGQDSEPTGAMLHRGGHVKLGSAYI